MQAKNSSTWFYHSHTTILMQICTPPTYVCTKTSIQKNTIEDKKHLWTNKRNYFTLDINKLLLTLDIEMQQIMIK
jgi:hypothetical protein